MDKALLREIILEQNQARPALDLGISRTELDSVKPYLHVPHSVIVSGMRRVGKSTLLLQIINCYYKDGVYCFNFEDERLLRFAPEDFNTLYELFLEIEGERNVFFFDEVQNAPKWELFVRRMQDKGCKFFITGSNASLLSRELGTRLTGRSVLLTLYPFSFLEFLRFKGYSPGADALSYTLERGKLKKYFNEYLEKGGMPEYLRYKDSSLLKRVYEDILYRDIVARYEIKEITALRELGLYLLSNLGGLFSYNSLKQILHLGSVNTVRSYISYLEDSFLIFKVNRFSYSSKQQLVANKKIYCIDNGLAESVAFKFSKNRGRFLENLVFIELKRRYQEIYYYKTSQDLEVDFLIRLKNKPLLLIQVTEGLRDEKVRNREIKALTMAMEELNLNHALILTEDDEEEIRTKKKKIAVKPVYKWLLADAVP